jgi:hypothetical protein
MNLEVDGVRTLINTMPTFFINMSGFQPSIFCWRIPRPPFGRKLPLFFLGSLNVRPSVLYFKGVYVNSDSILFLKDEFILRLEIGVLQKMLRGLCCAGR